jgi:hypothetical protein
MSFINFSKPLVYPIRDIYVSTDFNSGFAICINLPCAYFFFGHIYILYHIFLNFQVPKLFISIFEAGFCGRGESDIYKRCHLIDFKRLIENLYFVFFEPIGFILI